VAVKEGRKGRLAALALPRPPQFMRVETRGGPLPAAIPNSLLPLRPAVAIEAICVMVCPLAPKKAAAGLNLTTARSEKWKAAPSHPKLSSRGQNS
jgi:hypothetical protein